MFLPAFLSSYKMLFMNKLEFSSSIDFLVQFSETIGVVWFSVSFSPLLCIFNYCFYGKSFIYIKIKRNKRRNNTTFNGKQRDNVNKAQPPPTFQPLVQKSQVQENHGGRGKTSLWKRCEQPGAKVLDFGRHYALECPLCIVIVNSVSYQEIN